MAEHAKRYGGPLSDADIDSLVALIRSRQSEPSKETASIVDLGDPVAGRTAYDRFCSECHGDQGQGVNAISLNNAEFLALATDTQIREAISVGPRGTVMAAYGGQLAQDTIDDLVALIRSWEHEVVERETPVFTEFPETVVLNPDGPAPQFTLRDGRYLSAAQLDTAMRNASRLIILDARPHRIGTWRISPAPFQLRRTIRNRLSCCCPRTIPGLFPIAPACPHKYFDR